MAEPRRSARRENTPDHVPGRGARGRWLPGCSPNPGGRPKVIEDIRALARQHTEAAVNTLVSIAEDGKQESARVAAATALLDRGWGRPTQPISGDDQMPPVGFEAIAREREERAAQAVALIDATFGLVSHGDGNADL